VVPNLAAKEYILIEFDNLEQEAILRIKARTTGKEQPGSILVLPSRQLRGGFLVQETREPKHLRAKNPARNGSVPRQVSHIPVSQPHDRKLKRQGRHRIPFHVMLESCSDLVVIFQFMVSSTSPRWPVNITFGLPNDFSTTLAKKDWY
jgi:hypothetical protein